MIRRLCLPLLLLIPVIAEAQTPPAPLPDGYIRQQSLTFALDECGDPALGELYRKALTDKLNACPFDARARAQAIEAAQQDGAKEKAAIADYLKTHKTLPERLEGMNQSCKDMLLMPQINDLRAKLQRYAKGEISLSVALPDPCENFGPRP
jgi:hypothetical protein